MLPQGCTVKYAPEAKHLPPCNICLSNLLQKLCLACQLGLGVRDHSVWQTDVVTFQLACSIFSPERGNIQLGSQTKVCKSRFCSRNVLLLHACALQVAVSSKWRFLVCMQVSMCASTSVGGRHFVSQDAWHGEAAGGAHVWMEVAPLALACRLLCDLISMSVHLKMQLLIERWCTSPIMQQATGSPAAAEAPASLANGAQL